MRGAWNALTVYGRRSAVAIACTAASACTTPMKSLKGDLRWSVQANAGAPAARGAIHVGVDNGDWGGGIDLSAGAVSGVPSGIVVRTDVNLAVSASRAR
jgi:hypothetical protein